MASTKPTITSHRARTPERFWIPFQTLRCRRWRPAKTPGALRFVSLALHVLPRKGGRRRRNVSARKVSVSLPEFGNVFQKLRCKFAPHNGGHSQRTASLDVLAEPNYYSKCRETSSTHVFASHLSDVFGSAGKLLQSAALADSVVSLYTTGFPLHRKVRRALAVGARGPR